MELNNNNNDNNNNNNNNNNNRAEWKIQLTMQNKVHNKHQKKEEANLSLIVLNYYIIIFKE